MGKGTESEQGRLRGEAGLLPVQRWFFRRVEEGGLRRPGHFNQAVRIETGRLEEGVLRTSVKALVGYHDAFRFRYRKDGGGKVIQYYEEEAGGVEVKVADIRGKREGEVVELLSAWQSGFEVFGGKLYSVGYLKGEGGRGELHIAMHHLLVDGVSWRVIKEDLERIYGYLEERAREGIGEEELEGIAAEGIVGRKGTSYRQWAGRVERYAGGVNEGEGRYWEEILRGTGVYNGVLEGLSEGVKGEREVCIGRELTKKLLTEANEAYHTETNDILLSALCMALHSLTGEAEQYVTVEGHGREEGDRTDVTRTVGWFTTMYPVRLVKGGSIGETVKGVKEGIRRIPGRGFGYGAVYGYGEGLSRVVFNYLGQFDGGGDKGGWRFSGRDAGRTVGEENGEQGIVNLDGAVRGGELSFRITGQIGEGALGKFAEGFRGYLEEVTGGLSVVGRSYLTPSDVGWVVSGETLDRVQEGREIVWLGKANSLQEGFIYHYLRQGEEDDAYIVQSIWDYRGG
jgi:non-ribosomal peptide synthase protein (TIGR01720 family)